MRQSSNFFNHDSNTLYQQKELLRFFKLVSNYLIKTHTILQGAYLNETNGKFEWFTDRIEGAQIVKYEGNHGYGIFNWEKFPEDNTVWVLFYGGDATGELNKLPYIMIHENDDLIALCRINKENNQEQVCVQNNPLGYTQFAVGFKTQK